MASFIYNSCVEDTTKGDIDFAVDTFKLMLVTGDYVANKDTHLKRSDVTNQITGTGYTAGGATITCTVTKNTTADRVTLSFDPVSWASSTLAADGGVIYKSRGGASSADELVAFLDFGGTVSTIDATFTVGSSTITWQN